MPSTYNEYDGGNDNDRRDMVRMGQTQQFKRVLKPVALFFWFCVSQISWPYYAISIDAALINGGQGGLFWTFMIHTIFAFPLILSITEMANRSPSAGALYHWVSEYAPPQIQNPLSYLVGWCNLLAYLASNSSGFLVNGILIQILVSIINPSCALAVERWPVVIFAIMEVVFGTILNIWAFVILPDLQWAFFTIFVLAWILIVTSICITISPKATATAVFLNFSDSAGWNQLCLSIFVGQIAAISSVIGYDAMAHPIEETKDAAKTVAWATPSAFIFNSLLNLGLEIAVVFALPDLSKALNSAEGFGYVFIYVLRQLPWPGLSITCLVLIIVAFTGANMNYTMSVSREVFAFARVSLSHAVSQIHSNTASNASLEFWTSLFKTPEPG